ncbi:uncharacterized protein LOC129601284 [Paramacrobiotus metropolitanus]|uniref:uncharacterized protein LOC129601284 n=1 Tax=Paramacrobiotus metropolitanus TaxID=2943436 RepID=UPI00244570B9|nr:uncharacterized protein LOC129601284 [Paramacrobiotus metropolitanus]
MAPDRSQIALHNRKPLLTFGILQVLFGVAMLITDIINVSINAIDYAFSFSFFASGLYIGVFSTITGSCGIAAGRRLSAGQTPRSRRCLLITSMVLSILTTILTAFLVVVLGINLNSYIAFNYYYGDLCNSWHADYEYNAAACRRIPNGQAFNGSFVGLHCLMWICSLGQAITAGINMCRIPKPFNNCQAPHVVYVQPGYNYPPGVPVNPAAPGQQIHFVASEPAAHPTPAP